MSYSQSTREVLLHFLVLLSTLPESSVRSCPVPSPIPVVPRTGTGDGHAGGRGSKVQSSRTPGYRTPARPLRPEPRDSLFKTDVEGRV